MNLSKIKKIVIFVGLLIFVIGSQEAFSLPQYTISDYPGSPGLPEWNGGPFVIYGIITTYCLEIGETISFGTYYGSIDAYARQGGNLDSFKRWRTRQCFWYS